MPQPKNTPPAEAPPEAAALQKGEHNPFLEGLLQEGVKINQAIKGWYEQRQTVRDQARAAVSTGFCSDDQGKRVEELFPMPNRKKKGEDAQEGEGS